MGNAPVGNPPAKPWVLACICCISCCSICMHRQTGLEALCGGEAGSVHNLQLYPMLSNAIMNFLHAMPCRMRATMMLSQALGDVVGNCIRGHGI